MTSPPQHWRPWSVRALSVSPSVSRSGSTAPTASIARSIRRVSSASELARTARRNPTYATNPAEIRAGDAVRFLERSRDSNIPEPVASQLRALAGFHDARYALIPVEVRFEAGSASGTGRGVLRMAILDVRGSRLVFIGDIQGPDLPDYTPTLGATLARRFADLVVP